SECTEDSLDRFEARHRARREGLVETLTPKPRFPGDPGHSLRPGDVPQRSKQLIRIPVGQYLREVLGDRLVTVEVVSQIKWLHPQCFQRSLSRRDFPRSHGTHSVNDLAITSARWMSRRWVALEPPARSRYTASPTRQK